jgi:hypothetical protein
MNMHDSQKMGSFHDFIRDTTERVRFAEKLSGDMRSGLTLDKLREVNGYWYAPLGSDAYEGDFANPDYAVQAFGLTTGQHLSAFRYDVFGLLSAAVHGETRIIARFLETVEQLVKVGPDGAEAVVRDYYRSTDSDQIRGMLRRRFDPLENTLGDRLASAHGGDLSFLFLNGMKVDRVHEEMASFLFSLPEADLRDIGDTLADAYSLGLREEGKDSFKNRNVVTVILPMGGEALFRHIRASFARVGLLAHAAPVHRTPSNRQANYDHRFKYALYLDQKTVDSQIAMRREVFDELSDVLHAYSGVAHVGLFGEQPFSPSQRQSMVRADREMSVLYNRFTQLGVAIQQSHLPRHETSFCMISFPSPEIGPAFHEIFRDCVKVNTLSNSEYRPIQAALIDAMDGAEKVRVLGAPGNDTDITVILHPLSDAGKETAFENCLASVNIPVGEVFTSPVLKGTNGVLHVGEAFLDGLKYSDLRMVFRDGEAVDWSCSNFDDPEKGREYIRENIFYPHESLPLGEFAIGTNTVAYAMGVKHDIMGLLPVLILEKTGPHFAVGDTCYSREEDQELHDPDSGKRLVAVENERSALRVTDPDRAYTNRHVDITLPYSGLDSICAIHPDGREVYLMKGGRFVLPGTETLNLPLEGLGD